MDDLDARASEDYVFIARRNNSLSRSGRMVVFGSLLGVSMGIVLTFGFVWGAWPMLPFAGLEMLVLYAAFRHIDEHAGDYERVAIRGARVDVEVVEGRNVRRFEFSRYWARVVCAQDGARVALRSHGKEFELGRHLRVEQRALLAKALKAQLHGVG